MLNGSTSKSYNRTLILEALPKSEPGHPEPLGATQKDISAVTRIAQAAVSRWLRHLIACGEVRICGWREVKGPPVAMYCRGKGVHVAPPAKSLTEREHKRRFGTMPPPPPENEEADPGGWEDGAARRRAQRYADDAAAGRMVDPLVAHFFGRIQQGHTAQS
jgi:hypothetical protein